MFWDADAHSSYHLDRESKGDVVQRRTAGCSAPCPGDFGEHCRRLTSFRDGRKGKKEEIKALQSENPLPTVTEQMLLHVNTALTRDATSHGNGAARSKPSSKALVPQSTFFQACGTTWRWSTPHPELFRLGGAPLMAVHAAAPQNAERFAGERLISRQKSPRIAYSRARFGLDFLSSGLFA